MFGHYLDGDVRQARHAGEVGELRGHDFRRADAAAQRGLVHQEPRGGRVVAGQDRLTLPAARPGARVTWSSVTPGFDGQDRAGVVLGLQQPGQDA